MQLELETFKDNRRTLTNYIPKQSLEELITSLHSRVGSLSASKLASIGEISPDAFTAIHQSFELCHVLKMRGFCMN